MSLAKAFSPKEFQVWIASDNTTAGTSGLAASGMNLLDVDSVGFPSLNPNQVIDVRNGTGRTFKDEDFFQDNVLRVTEVSLAGTLHNDAGHKLLAQNICNDVTADISVASGFTASSQKYGNAVDNAASSLTVVIKSPEHTDAQSLVMPGMVVTNFSVSAEAGTEGGRYKFSATLQSGKKPTLNEATTAAGATGYVNTDIPLLSNGSSLKVFNTDVIMNSFTATIESPAVFTGVTSSGYDVVSRGAEISVTADTQVKYDGNTKQFVSDFDSQTGTTLATSIGNGNMFTIVNNNAFGVDIQNGIFTNVAYSEGDVMMLDCSIKAVDDGTDALITFDVSA